MPKQAFDPEIFRKLFLLLLVAVVTVIFFLMVRPFLMAVLLAAVLSAFAHPLYLRLLPPCKGKKGVASALTLSIVTVVVVVPMLGLAGVVVREAVQIVQQVRPWVERQLSQPTEIDRLFEMLPFSTFLEPYKDQVVEKLGEFVTQTGAFLVGRLAATTRGTAVFFFMVFIMLYAMYFFLIDGRKALDKILYYMPLGPEQEQRMVGKFVSVTRAMIKGIFVIGLLQGALGGLAFWVVGIEGAFFWGTVMAVLSIIPGVGTALVWGPAVIYLFAVGEVGAAIGLAIWSAGLVASVDNVLRPWLVGVDTKMPDLLILLGMLGGLVLFGAAGVIVGPIVAAVFLTVWDIYGTAFESLLPPVKRETIDNA